MSEPITTRINNNVKAVWNVDDPIYKVAICNSDGTIPSTITKPTDIDIGAIASELEYLRLFSLSLIKQLTLTNASTDFLKYTLENFFGSYRLDGETDAEWLNRVIATVFQPKVSRAAIIYALRAYSNQEPEIEDGSGSSAFSNVCFAGRNKKYLTTFKGKTFFVFPATANDFSSLYFFIIITIYQNNTANVMNAVNVINKMIAAGIKYALQIKGFKAITENFYYCSGNISSAIKIDSLNSQLGTFPDDFTRYDAIKYNSGKYSATGEYVGIFKGMSVFNSVTLKSTGTVYYQIAESTDGVVFEIYSTKVLVGTTSTVALTKKYFKLRFIFDTATWTDTTTSAHIDSIT